MTPTQTTPIRTLIVVPNWNGADELRPCLDSLLAQTQSADILVVDNGSIDDSLRLIEADYPTISLIKHSTNLGYTGGVNPGFARAISQKYDYVAPFNNDAVADSQWLHYLVADLQASPKTGIATCKILNANGDHLDSTGDYYTHWGLPYPRGRGEATIHAYDHETVIFGASGGASLYRVNMLQDIGVLDQSFFAYYEDVDISFRAQLAGWQVRYVPAATVKHTMSVTGNRIKGFFTYQTMKNLPILFWKNVPASLLPTIGVRFFMVYCSFFISAAARGQLWYALTGCLRSLLLLPKIVRQRRHIQSERRVSDSYIRSILHWDLPPNATRWRNIRQQWWKLRGRA